MRVPGAGIGPAPVIETHLIDPEARRERLRTFRFRVLDNSIRETAVAAVRGHTLEDKRRIMAAARRCGFTDLIVATFTGSRMVDDAFAEEAVATYGPNGLWAFSEVRVPVKLLRRCGYAAALWCCIRPLTEMSVSVVPGSFCAC